MINYIFNLNHRLEDTYLAQIPGKVLRCVQSPGGQGVEAGDRCKLVEGKYVPIIRWFGESGKTYPFNPVDVSEDYKFIEE